MGDFGDAVTPEDLGEVEERESETRVRDLEGRRHRRFAFEHAVDVHATEARRQSDGREHAGRLSFGDLVEDGPSVAQSPDRLVASKRRVAVRRGALELGRGQHLEQLVAGFRNGSEREQRGRRSDEDEGKKRAVSQGGRTVADAHRGVIFSARCRLVG